MLPMQGKMYRQCGKTIGAQCNAAKACGAVINAARQEELNAMLRDQSYRKVRCVKVHDQKRMTPPQSG